MVGSGARYRRLSKWLVASRVSSGLIVLAMGTTSIALTRVYWLRDTTASHFLWGARPQAASSRGYRGVMGKGVRAAEAPTSESWEQRLAEADREVTQSEMLLEQAREAVKAAEKRVALAQDARNAASFAAVRADRLYAPSHGPVRLAALLSRELPAGSDQQRFLDLQLRSPGGVRVWIHNFSLVAQSGLRVTSARTLAEMAVAWRNGTLSNIQLYFESSQQLRIVDPERVRVLTDEEGLPLPLHLEPGMHPTLGQLGRAVNRPEYGLLLAHTVTGHTRLTLQGNGVVKVHDLTTISFDAMFDLLTEVWRDDKIWAYFESGGKVTRGTRIVLRATAPLQMP